MKVTITTQKENALLARVELQGKVSFEGATPKRSDVLQQVASSVKAKPELVIIRKLEGHYGGSNANLTAYVYSDRAALERIEREYMRERNKLPEPEPEPEAAAEEPAKEASEEKKEEPEEKSEKKSEEGA